MKMERAANQFTIAETMGHYSLPEPEPEPEPEPRDDPIFLDNA
jgi:hypothetical protein